MYTYDIITSLSMYIYIYTINKERYGKYLVYGLLVVYRAIASRDRESRVEKFKGHPLHGRKT